MRLSTRGVALYLGLFLLVLGGGLLGGYVYKHEPLPDTLTVRIASPPTPEQRFTSGAVLSLEGSSVTIAGESGTQTLPLASGFLIEDLQASSARVSEGTRVNVGLGRNAYGFYVSGIVEIEGAP